MIGPLRKRIECSCASSSIRQDPDPTEMVPRSLKAKVSIILPPTVAAFNVFCWSPLSIGRFLQRALPWPHNSPLLGPFLFCRERPGLSRGGRRDRA